MKKLIPILLSAFILTGCSGAGKVTNSYRQISVYEAVAMMEQETAHYGVLSQRSTQQRSGEQIGSAGIYEHSGVRRNSRLEGRDCYG